MKKATKITTTYAIAIHGGAGTISRKAMSNWKQKAYEEVLKRALEVSHLILKKGGKAMDAVFEAVKIMEDSSLFNAGKASVYTDKGTHEMDAAIMNGANLKAGAVAAVKLVKNPIELARTIMKKSRHVMLMGDDALDYARAQGLKIESPEYFHDESRYKQWQKAHSKDVVGLDHDSGEEKFGTVGAVALDKRGNLAAATSTGGIVNKKHGRVGDSPIIGAGTYADNASCAISCTGVGEYFIRYVVAHEVACRIKYKGQSLEEASQEMIHETLLKAGGRGGLIAVDTKGTISMPFNTSGMYRGYKRSSGELFIGIYE